MNLKTSLIFSLLFFFLCHQSNAQRLIYDEKIPVEKLRVVLEQARGGKVSEMLTDLEYIPLQGGKGNLIDYVRDIQVIGDRIGVLSNNGGHFYLYNMEGTLVKKIDKINGFKSPYPNSGTISLFFNIQKVDDCFLLNHGAFQARVDLQGNILDTLTLKGNYSEREDGQFVFKEVTLGKEKSYKYFGLNQNKVRLKHDLVTLNDSVLIGFDPVDTLEVMYNEGSFSKVYDDKLFLTSGYNTKIFELGDKGINKIYELILPLRNTFDYHVAKGLKQGDWVKTSAFFGGHADKVYGLDNVFFYKGYLIFNAKRWHNPVWLAYHLEKREVIGLSNIVADTSNDYLNFFDVNYIFAEGEYLYSMIYPSHVTSAKNKSMEEGHKMRKEHQDLTKYNNPILVRFKLK